MVNESKINEISDGDAVIKTSMDLPPVLSTIEVQSLLLKKLRLAMDRLIESNAAMSAENSMLRHSTPRQRMSQQYSDEDKLLLHFGGTSDQLKDRKSVRFSLSNVPKVGIDNLEEDRNSSPRQLKNFFAPELVDVKTIPLKEELSLKKREIAHWKKKFVEKEDRVNELELAFSTTTYESTILDEDKLLLHFGGTSDQLKDRKSVRFSLSNVPKVGTDNLEEDRNSSPRQLKDFFGPELFDVKAVPLKEQLLMKEREIARWRKKFLERGDRVNELKLALRQKDKDSMNAINESNALVQKKSLEIKHLLDKQREIDVNKLKSKLPPDNASTSRFGAKPFSSIFSDKPMVKPTDYPNASFFLRLQRQDPKSNKGNYGETPRRAPAA
eukprot:CAMPEP_0194442454 /NCGR_PEP_ID=MMETSP0176-20130528/126140_1 /TAXON_ID=216777 /ORGANISM="Proboscia alata, Strain PI-D3" /LENGTH=382 /DNA_ID=CAMNT_0039268555 /DNA_START=34 /DNA_END=1183 /DNA_ORIENTATION=+